jgi:hypothetical protein
MSVVTLAKYRLSGKPDGNDLPGDDTTSDSAIRTWSRVPGPLRFSPATVNYSRRQTPQQHVFGSIDEAMATVPSVLFQATASAPAESGHIRSPPLSSASNVGRIRASDAFVGLLPQSPPTPKHQQQQ